MRQNASRNVFVYPEDIAPEYADYDTPKELADRIKEVRDYINLLSEHHEEDMELLRLALQPWTLEIDDGNLDAEADINVISEEVSEAHNVPYEILTFEGGPLPLYNSTPENWPLKISPNHNANYLREQAINAATNNKNRYKTTKNGFGDF